MAAQFYGDSGFRVSGTHGKCVCDYFLYKKSVGGFGKRLSAATAKCNSEILAGEKGMRLAQDLIDFLGLHGVVALIRIVQKFRCLGIDYSNFHSGGANIDSNP